MLSTIFGDLLISIQNTNIDYQLIPLSTKGPNFHVDERYLVIIKLPMSSTPLDLKCVIVKNNNTQLKAMVETGEDLALVSFLKPPYKMSIGTEGDIKGYKYEYKDNGITIRLNNSSRNQLHFVISWKRLKNIDDGINTWLASDPASVEIRL